jgi:hypothetical protein
MSGDLDLDSRSGLVLGRGAARYRDSYRIIPSPSEGEREEGCQVAMPLTLALSQQEADLKVSRKAGLTKTFYGGVRVKASIVNGSGGADQGAEHRLGLARQGAARLGRMPRGEQRAAIGCSLADRQAGWSYEAEHTSHPQRRHTPECQESNNRAPSHASAPVMCMALETTRPPGRPLLG